MTDEEFEQMVQGIAAMARAHPEFNAIALGPATIAEFEKRGIELPLKPYPATVVEGPVTMTDMINAAWEQQQ